MNYTDNVYDFLFNAKHDAILFVNEMAVGFPEHLVFQNEGDSVREIVQVCECVRRVHR